MSEIRLVATDLDGTLLDSEKNVPAGFWSWVFEHPEIAVVIGSGRAYSRLRVDFFQGKDRLYFMADNGAMVYHRDELLFADEMPKEMALACLDYVEGNEKIVPVLSCAKRAYIPEVDSRYLPEIQRFYDITWTCKNLREEVALNKIAKIALYIPSCESKTLSAQIDKAHLPVHAVASAPDWIDMMRPDINKGTALSRLQKHLGVEATESMAFGDYLNDIEMLMCCSESYAMSNAIPEVKAVARYVTASNDEDGVMRVLRRIEGMSQ